MFGGEQGGLFGPTTSWQQRLAVIVETMREISSQADPQEMVRAYTNRMRGVLPQDRTVSLSRRGHEYPEVRITRDSERTNEINPWTQRDRLPVVRGGLLAELLYADAPRIIDALDVPDSEPGAPYLAGQRSLIAIPLYDQGVALNMVVFLRRRPRGFEPENLPEYVWMANLFGRATHSLVLSAELRAAYESVDREMRVVADIQRSLLPAELPQIPTLELAAHYQTSRRAGGDYYDFFPLTDGRWGLLIADVSGHGVPAAVVMAITHAMAHTHPDEPCPPGKLLMRLNRQLAEIYTRGNGTFVTAFYGIYDPRSRELQYASAGHNPPRVRCCATNHVYVLSEAGGLPLGISPEARYEDAVQTLLPGQQLILYTDGITEAFNPAGEMFGVERLDGVLGDCDESAAGMVRQILAAVDAFQQGTPIDDDRTLVVAKVR